jgi:hypothetical protein
VAEELEEVMGSWERTISTIGVKFAPRVSADSVGEVISEARRARVSKNMQKIPFINVYFELLKDEGLL